MSLITIGLLAPLPGAFAAETALKVVDVSLPAVSLLQSPLFAAMESGAFKKYGMEVRYIVTGARSIQALIGGSVQFRPGSFESNRALGGAGRIRCGVDRQLQRQIFIHHAQRAGNQFAARSKRQKSLAFPASVAAPISPPGWRCAKLGWCPTKTS